jgi:hypothetical protein
VLPAHPPPSDLSRRELPIKRLRQPFHRVHSADFGAIYFGQKGRYDNRFDIDAGVMYLALEPEGAFLEAVLRDCGLGGAARLLSEAFLASRKLSRVEFQRELRMIDISDDGAARLGLDVRIATGGDYRLSQAWALALWAHPERPDGLFYASRHNAAQRCVAVFGARSNGPTAEPNDPEPEACVSEAYQGTFLEPPYSSLLDKYRIGLT